MHGKPAVRNQRVCSTHSTLPATLFKPTEWVLGPDPMLLTEKPQLFCESGSNLLNTLSQVTDNGGEH